MVCYYDNQKQPHVCYDNDLTCLQCVDLNMLVCVSKIKDSTRNHCYLICLKGFQV